MFYFAYVICTSENVSTSVQFLEPVTSSKVGQSTRASVTTTSNANESLKDSLIVPTMSTKAGAKIFKTKCSQCHTYEKVITWN